MNCLFICNHGDSIHFMCAISIQVQDKFRLDLNDEEAVMYLQALIDESVSAVLASLAEQMHKWAQVSVSCERSGRREACCKFYL